MAISPYIRSLRQRIGHDLLILPSVCAIVMNAKNEVLLQHNKDINGWATIGGIAEEGEEPADAVVREVMEEAGIVVEPLRITSVSNSPVVTYPNGDKVQYVIATFLCRHVGGEPRVNDDESNEIRYFPLDKLPPLREDQLQRVRWVTSDNPSAGFIPPGRSRNGAT